jgi:WD40 repeat protein
LNTVLIAPDGKWVATGGDRGVRLWNPATGQLLLTLFDYEQVSSLATGFGGHLLTAVWHNRDNSQIAVYDLRARRLNHLLTTKSLTTKDLAIAPNGSWIATGGYQEAMVWDIRKGKLRHILPGHSSAVTAIAAAHDGDWLATVSDKEVRLWNAETGRLRHVLASSGTKINALAVAPDGTRLVTVNDSGTVQVWGTRTGKCISAIRTDRPLGDVATDGTRIIATGSRGHYLLSVSAGNPSSS